MARITIHGYTDKLSVKAGDELFEIEHLGGHHFFLTLELQPQAAGTNVIWRQTFDTTEHYQKLAEFVAKANEQNLDRLAAEVVNGQSTA